MNRSSKGFGITGVLVAVIVLMVSAVISTSASSQELHPNQETSKSLG